MLFTRLACCLIAPLLVFALTEYVTPLEQEQVVCRNEAESPGHADIRWDAVVRLASKACNSWKGTTDGIVDAGDRYYSSSLKAQGVDYDFSATWIPGCVTTTPTQSVYHPLGSDDPECAGLLMTTYTLCKFCAESSHTQSSAHADLSRRQQWRRRGIRGCWLCAIFFYWWQTLKISL